MTEPAASMDPSRFKVISFIKFPPIESYDIDIASYVRCLMKHHRKEVESGSHNTCSTTVLVNLCKHIVMVASKTIMDDISPIMLHWQRQVVQLYRHVNPIQCFFGIDESDVLANMTTILPKCFSNALHTRETDCESLTEFIHMVAREVTLNVNSCIAQLLNSYTLPSQLCDCNCINYISLNTMIPLVNQTLRCREYCECKPQKLSSRSTTSTSILHIVLAKVKFLRVLLQQGPCDVLYYTANKDIQDILSEITEYSQPINENEYVEIWNDGFEFDSERSSSLDSFSEELNFDTDTFGDDVCSTMQSESDGLQHVDWRSSATFIVSRNAVQSSDPPADNRDTGCTEAEYRLNKVVLSVLAGLLMLTTQMARQPLCREQVEKVIKNLAVKVRRRILPTDNIINSNTEIVKACKDLYRDLHKKFGSAKLLLEAMTSQDLAAEAVIIQTLKTHLIARPPKPKNIFVRFFQSVGKVMKKPFTACLSRCTKT